MHVPELCDIEFASALRHLLRRRGITPARADAAIDDYLDLPLTRHAHAPLLSRILELRDLLSAYDATYVALAEALNAPLLTGDLRLARAIRASRGIRVPVW